MVLAIQQLYNGWKAMSIGNEVNFIITSKPISDVIGIRGLLVMQTNE